MIAPMEPNGDRHKGATGVVKGSQSVQIRSWASTDRGLVTSMRRWVTSIREMT